MSGYLTILLVICTTSGTPPPGYQKGSDVSMSSPLDASSTGVCPPPHRPVRRNMAPGLPTRTMSFCPLNPQQPPPPSLRYDPPEAARPLWLRRPCGAAMRDTVAAHAAAEALLLLLEEVL